MSKTEICGCCGKPVSTENMELTFRLPDVIAGMRPADIDRRCRIDDEICVIDGTRFFLRCVLPVPVHGREKPYSFGPWAEIGRSGIEQVLSRWSGPNQAAGPAIPGKLANLIPLVYGSLNCDIEVSYRGPDDRPAITVLDSSCSLFQEQRDGVSAHRIGEFSDFLAGLFESMAGAQAPVTH